MFPILFLVAVLLSGVFLLLLLIPMQLTARLEVEQEVLANFRIRWLLADRRWHRRWPFPDLGHLLAMGAPQSPPSRTEPLQSPAFQPGRDGHPQAAQLQELLRFWPVVRRRLRWRRMDLRLVVGPGSRPDLAAIGCGALWGLLAPVLRVLGVPRRVARLSVVPAMGTARSQGVALAQIRLRPLHALWVAWQAYRAGLIPMKPSRAQLPSNTLSVTRQDM